MMIKRIKETIKDIRNTNYDLLWAKIWDDTRRGMKWLDNLSGISPGRWAVGYNYIYVMTRVLDTVEPQFVLDLGLGISSTLISCWFNYLNNYNARHIIIEQDMKWKEFYLKKNKLSSSCEIKITNCIEKEFEGYKYLAYENFEKIVSGKHFSVISIDGPWGSERHSRRDIVDCLPAILEKEFVILMDDTNRKGERETVNEIVTVLKKNGIDIEIGWYLGATTCTVICSSKYKFLCSL